MINPQKQFLIFLRNKRNLYAADEVSHYGCRADVLAVDANKSLIIEYEFKESAHDLKVLEKRKSKYQLRTTYLFKGQSCYTVEKEPSHPHKFYFVVPSELYDKEKDYLEAQKTGIISYHEYPKDQLNFVVMKSCFVRKKHLQKYERAVINILASISYKYANKGGNL